MKGLVDVDLHLCLAVFGDNDVLDGPERLAADQDLVAADQLAAGLKQELVGVPAVAAHEQHDHRHGGEYESHERGNATHRQWAPALGGF